MDGGSAIRALMALRMTLACPAMLLTGCLHLSWRQLAAKALLGDLVGDGVGDWVESRATESRLPRVYTYICCGVSMKSIAARVTSG